MSRQKFVTGMQHAWQWGIGLAGAALLIIVLIFSRNLLPQNASTTQPANLTGAAPSITPLPPSLTPKPTQAQGIASGDWVAAISPTRTPLPETYTVQEGDTWTSIASTFNRSVQYLQTLNGTELFVGKVLRIRAVVFPPPTPDVEIPEGVVVIDHFAGDALQDSDTIKAIADEFNQSQSVYYVRVTGDDYVFWPEGFTSEDVLAKYDCFAGGLAQEHLASAYNLSALLDADPDGVALLEDIPAEMWAAARRDGSTYGLPVASQPLVIYYNQSHFEALGLDLPVPGWTVEDFWSLASAASTNSVYGFVPIQDYSFLFTEQGITLIDIFSDPPQVSFNTPETLQIVRTLAEQVANRVTPKLDDDSVQFALASERGNYFRDNGLAAMWTSFAGFPYGGYGYEPHDYAVGVAPLPLGDGQAPLPLQVISFFISPRAASPEGCWEWGKFLSGQPGAFLGGIPARQSVLEFAEYEDVIGVDAAAAYRAVMQQPFPETPANQIAADRQFPVYPLRTMWSTTLVSIVGGADPASALDALQARAEVYLDCIALANLSQSTPSHVEKVEACALQADPNYSSP